MRGVITGSAAIIFFLVTTLILGAGRSDIADAAMKGDKAAIRTLIQQKADVNAQQVDGATAHSPDVGGDGLGEDRPTRVTAGHKLALAHS